MTLNTVAAVEKITSVCPAAYGPPQPNDPGYVDDAVRMIVLTSAIGHLVASDQPTVSESYKTLQLLDMIRMIANLLYQRGAIPHFPEVSSVELLIGSPES